MKNPKIKPREYQRECLVAIDNAIANGEKRALVVMASGLGKTYTSAFAVERYLANKRFARVLVLCHSEKILRQTKEKFQEYFGEEFSYGMYVNYDKTTRPTNFLFATFQTMKDNRKEFPKDEFAYIIVDEAHHSHARTYFPTIRYFEPEFLLGLTATPDRLDGQKIEEIYGEPVYELGFVEATKRGLIAECDYRLVLDDLSQERLDEYLASDEKLSIKQLNRTLFIKKRDEEIVRLIGEYSAGVENPKTMIFCRTVEHARKIAKLIGDKAALVYKKNGDSANDRALKSFKEGEINTIISVDMLNEGIDVPDANVVVFLRNTVSPAVFYQQLGRGTRLSEGKDKVLVLDFVDNCERIKTILELKQEIDNFKVRPPHGDEGAHGDGDANSKEKFTLNIATLEFKEQMVDILEVLERAQNSLHWSVDAIVEFIRRLGADLGRTPHISDVRNCSEAPSINAIIRNCGSFNRAVELAGFKPYSSLTEDDARRLLIEKAVDGIMPSRSVFDKDPELPWSRTIINALGAQSWPDAARMVKLKIVDKAGKKLTDDEQDELVALMACRYYEESIKVGHWLTAKELNYHSELKSASTYLIYFKSMFNLRAKATEMCCSSKEEMAVLTQGGKIENRKSLGRSSIGMSEEYVMEGIKQLTVELRRKPTIEDINDCRYLPSYGSIHSRFKSLKKLYARCKIDDILLSIGAAQEKTLKKPIRSELIVFQLNTDGSISLIEDKKYAMQEYVRKVGRKLQKRDLCQKNGLPSESTFRRYGFNMNDVNIMIEAETILAEANN